MSTIQISQEELKDFVVSNYSLLEIYNLSKSCRQLCEEFAEIENIMPVNLCIKSMGDVQRFILEAGEDFHNEFINIFIIDNEDSILMDLLDESKPVNLHPEYVRGNN
jgi:hypothetical protein